MDRDEHRLRYYTTVSRKARIEMEERRSRFIGICIPVRDSAEAEEHLRACRAEHPEATHVVFAWQTALPERQGRFSDDGEPQGTAGLPVLDVLRKREVDQAQILVVRYFGGILLGAGGLVRAYSKAASMALDAAVPLRMELRHRVRLTAPYDVYDRLRYALDQAGFYQEVPQFGMDAEWVAASSRERLPELLELAASISAGAVLSEEVGIDYAPVL